MHNKNRHNKNKDTDSKYYFMSFSLLIKLDLISVSEAMRETVINMMFNSLSDNGQECSVFVHLITAIMVNLEIICDIILLY